MKLHIIWSRDHTLSFKGFKNVDSSHTGGRKKRFTVCLAINLEGKMLKAMVIFRGKYRIWTKRTEKFFLTVSKSGSMDTSLAKIWSDEVFSNRGPYFFNMPSLLMWDSYGSHEKEEIKRSIYVETIGSEMCLIPKRKTYFAQPLDVSINSPFKHTLKVLWSDWFKNSPPLLI